MENNNKNKKWFKIHSVITIEDNNFAFAEDKEAAINECPSPCAHGDVIKSEHEAIEMTPEEIVKMIEEEKDPYNDYEYEVEGLIGCIDKLMERIELLERS